MKKMKIKKTNRKNKFVFFLILIFIFLFLSFSYINESVKPLLLSYAEIEIKKLSSIIINRAVSKQLVENASIDDLFLIEKDTTGNIKTIDFNSIVVNKFLSTMVNSIHLNLKQIEEGNVDLLELPDDFLITYDEKKLKKGIIYEVPVGLLLKYPIFVNVLPKVPVRFHLVGDISSNVHTSITNYGINNALVEVDIHIKVTMMTILPLMTEQIEVETSVPLAIKLVEGKIPEYYFNGMERESVDFTLPFT